MGYPKGGLRVSRGRVISDAGGCPANNSTLRFGAEGAGRSGKGQVDCLVGLLDLEAVCLLSRYTYIEKCAL